MRFFVNDLSTKDNSQITRKSHEVMRPGLTFIMLNCQSLLHIYPMIADSAKNAQPPLRERPAVLYNEKERSRRVKLVDWENENTIKIIHNYQSAFGFNK